MLFRVEGAEDAIPEYHRSAKELQERATLIEHCVFVDAYTQERVRAEATRETAR